MRTGIYVGSFDPVTNGHADIIQRSALLVDRLVVGVLVDAGKHPAFSLEQRAQMLKKATETLKNVSVQWFSGALLDFAQQQHADVIIRGLRSEADFEYEASWARMNRQLGHGLETIFLMSSPETQFLSSTHVRTIAQLGFDVTPYVPQCIAKEIIEGFRR